MNQDPNQTSTKLRIAAAKFIKNRQRPMTSHEIETLIRENDKELSKVINSKCSDYVRIILSITQDNNIIKFRSLQPIQGIDKRSTFYGLSDVNYDSTKWTVASNKVPKSKKSPVSFPATPIIEKEETKPAKIEQPSKESSLVLPLIDDVHSFDSIFEDFKSSPFDSSLYINYFVEESEFSCIGL
ncbi:hypothetical protein TVAG_413190 [Trichomonas vaginalis G3]|uniref:Uncharacterized protein n=1 Tax=Trichomonas vaginalis (strain ATCC PRA-98 / G3) TaxID=412133 RepID=A2FY72_TRIV3|nr:hypothetical protein TVAGG3_0193080 [Trichomonas vaginalis G3]EAX90150.1 hypothetical protein TVAG_413190 [Trichomonas vaginalis G3]KAI5550116.1 hypothetical protein TVAGG3_0193080 [Trichomonas vaginalis G3]|eukprot:XP_001303080.1 hypothetical protein [Trichomonas vaginalis G3]